AVFLIAAMIARPFLRAGTAAALLGATARTERIMVLDDSFSMGYRLESGQAVFDRAVQAAKQITQWLATECPDDSLTLLLTSSPRQSALALTSISPESSRKAGDVLDALSPSQLPAHYPQVAAALAELVRRSQTQANLAIYVLSDFQRSDWNSGGALSPLADAAKGRTGVKLSLVDVAAESPSNIAVTDLHALQSRVVAGVPARFEVEIANHTPKALTQLEVALTLGQRPLPSIVIPRVAPEQTAREPFEVTFPEEGPGALKVQLAGTAPDGLALDNSRVAAVSVAHAVEVLIVDGEPSSDSLRDETYLLKTALHPAGRSSSGNEVTVLTEQELDAAEWNKFQVVALANVARLSAAAIQSLEQFVAQGGGLVIFAGHLVDADFYNRELFKEGAGLLPARVGEAVHAPPGAEPFGFGDWDENHPIMRPFSGPLATVLRQVRVNQFLTILPQSVPATSQSAEPRILARYNDPQRSTALMIRPYKRGQVALVTTSADQDWNDWGGSFSYVPFMLELFQYLCPASSDAIDANVGQPLQLPLELSAMRKDVRLRSPGYPVDPEIPITVVANDRGQTLATYEHPSKAGIWTFELTSNAGQPVERFAAVNPDPAESDLTRVARPQLDTQLADLKYDYVRDLSAFTRDTSAARTEIWWPVLIAAVIALMSEHALAWYFGTRG
ncbi:MAG TPA: hypothetical protein VMV81_10225, partial [Phycisphaerae bacterium]|nr:hypothetical protein [Phycisphaerae bacterium]